MKCANNWVFLGDKAMRLEARVRKLLLAALTKSYKSYCATIRPFLSTP